MFRCEGCPTHYNKKRKATKGNTFFSVTQFKVTTVQRKVLYINQVRFDKEVFKEGNAEVVSTFKNVSQTTGFETVEEKWYCKEHLPKDFKPRVLDKVVERINLVGIRRGNRGDR